MNLELDADKITILKDGVAIGAVNPNGGFSPVDGLHHKTIEATQRWVDKQELVWKWVEQQTASLVIEPKAKPTFTSNAMPDKDPALGDLTPALIDWRFENWSELDFNELYPPYRLRAISHVFKHGSPK